MDPVCKLALKFQHYNAALCDIPDLPKKVIGRLNEISSQKEYSASATNFIQERTFPILDSTKVTDQEIHKSVVIPYIKALSENIKKWFNDTVAAMCSATSIFGPKKVKDDVRYGITEVVQLLLFIPALISDLQDEWKTFRNYLKVQASKQGCPTAKLVLHKLASQGGGLSFPSNSFKIILVCPLDTASVEWSFSTMGRICNRLRQRMLPENLAHCMRVSAEGPNTLTVE